MKAVSFLDGVKKRRRSAVGLSVAFAFCAFLMASASRADAAHCLYVSSYHPEYYWNVEIEKGLDAALNGACEISRFYMDTKRNKGREHAERKAAEAKHLIDETRPDVVIACDDNASKYLVVPYLKDVATPVIFCGVNWTVDSYGYPYSNLTGIVEVAPIAPLIDAAMDVVGNTRRLIYLAADVPTQHKELARVRQLAGRRGLEVQSAMVSSLDAWVAAVRRVSSEDILMLGSSSGISDWNDDRAMEIVVKQGKAFSITIYSNMAPLAMLAMMKTGVEHGEWAGEIALILLEGESPANIPIVASRRWSGQQNRALLDAAGYRLPDAIARHAASID